MRGAIGELSKMNIKFFLKDEKYKGIHKRIYAPSDVKEQFPQLQRLQDKTIVPILEGLLEGWLNLWGVDEMEPMHPQEDSRLNPSLAPHVYPYVFAVDNKLVKVAIRDAPLDIFQASVPFNDNLRDYEVIRKATFYCAHQKSVEKLFHQFKDFSAQQDLEKIMSRCSERIRSAWSMPISLDLDALDQEMSDFYL